MKTLFNVIYFMIVQTTRLALWFMMGSILFFMLSCEKSEVEPEIREKPVYLTNTVRDTIVETDTIEVVPEYRKYPVRYEFYTYTIERLSMTDYRKWERRNVGELQMLSDDLQIMSIMDIKADPVYSYGYKSDKYSKTQYKLTLHPIDGDPVEIETIVKDIMYEEWSWMEYGDKYNYLHTIYVKAHREKIPY